ncbi:hypothetical protein PspLS_07955 [Pyricularia sp. CBS 133598]|nr:hypothetical protein PspLS_07955 [Pyricularia sp. CBS 133598]
MGCGTQNVAMGSIDSPAWPGPPKNAGGNPTTNNFLAYRVWTSASSVLVPDGFLSVLVGPNPFLGLGRRTMIIIARGKRINGWY